MPKPVHCESFAAAHMESCLLTERLRLSQRRGMPLSSLNPPHEPLECCPGKRTFAPGEILHHELSSRSQQPFQPCQSRSWLRQIVQGICEGDQVKGLRRVAETCCLARTDHSSF